MVVITDSQNYLNYQIIFDTVENNLLINFTNKFMLELQKSENKRDKFKTDSRRLFESLELDINNPNVAVETVIKNCFSHLMKTPENRIFSTLQQAITKQTPYNAEVSLNPQPEQRDFDYELANLYLESSLFQITEGEVLTVKAYRVGSVNQLNVIATVDYNAYPFGTNPTNAIDFTPSIMPSGVLTFLPYENEKEITISLANTEISELTESFQIVLSNATNANLFRNQCVVQVINVP